MIFSPLKKPKMREFTFIPRTYDPVQEDLEQRIELAKKEMELSKSPETKEEYERVRRQISFRDRWQSPEKQNVSGTLGALVLMVIFMVFVLSYSLLDGLEDWVLGALPVLIIGYVWWRVRAFKKKQDIEKEY
jgi:hypothetical protein